MAKNRTIGIITIITGFMTLALYAMLIFIYPSWVSNIGLFAFLGLMTLLLSVYLIYIGYEFYRRRLPSLLKSNRKEGAFMIIAGIIILSFPFLSYFSGYRNPITIMFFFASAYFIFLGRSAYRGELLN